jgi:peptidoglycan/LPS O-acetylase OafA/YrhL
MILTRVEASSSSRHRPRLTLALFHYSAACYALAALSWTLLEKPFLRLGSAA